MARALPGLAPGGRPRFHAGTRRELGAQGVRGAGARERQVIPARASGQPAFAYYLRDAHASVARNLGVFVITLRGDRIAALTRFGDTGFLPHFGLPRMLPA